MKKFFVLDQNYLRSEALQAIIQDNREANFIFTTASLKEIIKSSDWRTTMQHSLPWFPSCSSRVHLAVGLGEAFRFELKNWRSIEGQLLERELRKNFIEQILAFLKNPFLGHQNLERRIQQLRTRLAADELSHQENHERLLFLRDSMMDILPRDFIKQLRNGSASVQDRLVTITRIAPSVMEEVMSNVPRHRRPTFLRRKPFLLRFYYLRIWLCLRWISRGGLDGRAPEDSTNDFFDLEYVIFGSFFDGALSGDHLVREAQSDLQLLLKMPVAVD
ncbi:MAG: hypothetical protein MUE46_04835 [Xanthomonadales bacterium]|jgi:hypothetical protein|nr:hypothetical protein [Xanthomonadales bacterium]